MRFRPLVIALPAALWIGIASLLGGVAIVAGAAAPVVGIILLAAGGSAVVIGLIAVSYVAWRDDPDRHRLGG